MIRRIRRVSVCLFTLLGIAVLAKAARAYDPVPALRNLYGAPHAVAWLIQVKPGQESRFVDAMVASGPYDKLLSGFANEKLLEPLPSSTGSPLFISFSRYYDTGTAQYVESERMQKMQEYVASSPRKLELTLVEHMLADWGWEKGTKPGVIRAEAFGRDEIFQKNLSSLSFFKAGYVGQIGVLEFFDEPTSIDTVRERIKKRSGLSGASIYKVDGQKRYVVYSEFFKTPSDMADQRIKIAPNAPPAGLQAGVVVQNYIPR